MGDVGSPTRSASVQRKGTEIVGKRIKDLEAELAATKAELADSQDRRRRATAHVNAHVQAEREREAAALRRAKDERDAQRRQRETEAEAARQKARAERLEALRRGEVKLTNGDIVSVDYETGEVQTFTVTLALDRDEAAALHEYVRERSRPRPRGASFGAFFDELARSFTLVGS